MKAKRMDPEGKQIAPPPESRGVRVSYRAPVLTVYGDVRGVTLGGSPDATFDSGDGSAGKRPT